jgi:hypothetical protein
MRELALLVSRLRSSAAARAAAGEQNGSGQSGTVTLTADGEKTKVVIMLEHPPAAPQPS